MGKKIKMISKCNLTLIGISIKAGKLKQCYNDKCRLDSSMAKQRLIAMRWCERSDEFFDKTHALYLRGSLCLIS